jgi:hypothetical protein
MFTDFVKKESARAKSPSMVAFSRDSAKSTVKSENFFPYLSI